MNGSREEAMNSSDQAAAYLKTLSVMYVDDEEDARNQFAPFLKRLAGELIIASNGQEGLDLCLSRHPHIIITDIRMPLMDGLSMIREIRNRHLNTHVIVLTAFEEIDYLRKAIDSGVDKYVTKPVSGFELQEALLACAEKLRADEQLHRAASIDRLTGLANRWELNNRFNAEKSMAERHDLTFSVIIIDIDYFKKVNDTYGHNAGDLVLKAVADTIISSLRTEDICGRWGGEEFLLILPATDTGAAAAVAEKLRNTVSELSVPWHDTTIHVTISLGIAGFRHGDTMQECIEPADGALYRAKNGGRNRYEIADG